MIVLDTSVLSHVFRRPAEHSAKSKVVAQYTALVEDGLPLVIPGIAYQEILSGVRDDLQLARLRRTLEGFPRILAEDDDHFEAARLMNLLRRQGISVSSIDALIAAMTIRRDALLFTLDRDFDRFTRRTPLKLLPQ